MKGCEMQFPLLEHGFDIGDHPFCIPADGQDVLALACEGKLSPFMFIFDKLKGISIH